ncbi:MAG: hypothetical protein AAFX08_09270 [Pseudomonadota bacterium]
MASRVTEKVTVEEENLPTEERDAEPGHSVGAPAAPGASPSAGGRILVHRPCKRDRTFSITDAGVEEIRRCAAEGMTLETIAKRLGITGPTFRKMRKRDPRVDEAVELGYSQMEDELVGGLMARFRQGMLNPKDRGAITAAIFLLRGRRGYQGDKVPAHITINNDNRTQTIQLPTQMDMDEYRKKYLGGRDA